MVEAAHVSGRFFFSPNRRLFIFSQGCVSSSLIGVVVTCLLLYRSGSAAGTPPPAAEASDTTPGHLIVSRPQRLTQHEAASRGVEARSSRHLLLRFPQQHQEANTKASTSASSSLSLPFANLQYIAFKAIFLPPVKCYSHLPVFMRNLPKICLPR